MKYMLDTNTCIFLMKNYQSVVDKYKANQAQGICISSITASELYYGVYNSKTPELIAVHLTNFLTGVQVLDYTAAASDCYGEIRANLRRMAMPIGELDTLIAAHAKSENLILVTNNTKEFSRVCGLTIEDWL